MKKKNVLTFLIKKTPLLYARLESKQKTFSNCQATCQKELCLLLKIMQFYSQSERTDRLDPAPSPYLF